MKDINLAILGFGFMGKVYSYAAECIKFFYPDAPRICISSVLASKNTDKTYLKKRYHFQSVTEDYETILNNKLIDAVYVALPNDLHSNYVIPAIDANKSILCEKPLEINLEKATRMIEHAKKNKSIVTNVVFEYRFLPAISLIKNYIDKNMLGRILQFRILYLHGSYAQERPMTWRLLEGVGGALLDLGPHVIDLTMYLLGPIKNVNGKIITKYLSRKVDDIAQILCETEKGAEGYLEVSRLSVGSIDELRIEIHGEEGSVKWNLENMNFVQFFNKGMSPTGYKMIPTFTDPNDKSDFPPEKVSSDWLRPHIHCLYNFIKKVQNNDYVDKKSATFNDGLNVQKIVQSVKDSQ